MCFNSLFACLCSAIKELKCELLVGHGYTGVPPTTFKLARFTLISTAVSRDAIAISSDAIARDLLSQFSNTEHFEPYTRDDVDSLARQIAAQIDLNPDLAARSVVLNQALPREIFQLNPDLAARSVVALGQALPREIFQRLSELKERETARLIAEAETAANADALRRQEEKTRNEKISLLVSAAKASEEQENSKWLRKKDFTRARELYAQARDLGSSEAEAALKRLGA